MKKRIDINADLGEGSGQDEVIMRYISSCSIACGGHYGNEETMTRSIRLAQSNGVKVGAHPSFPDKDNFGRKIMTLTRQELTRTLFEQLLRFMAVCEDKDVSMHHVKLHGALYNFAAIDAATSDAVVTAMDRLKLRVKLYCPFGSVLHQKARNLFPLVFEGFIDRRYRSDGSLVPRSEKQAVIHDGEPAWEQLKGMVEDQSVRDENGRLIGVRADTFCIHGDHPNSVMLLEFIAKKMREHNYILDK